MRKSNSLTALGVARETKRGKHPDGGGLYLQVSEWGTKAWLFRYERANRDRWMGLGPYPLISLAEAREKAVAARKALLAGVDPLTAKSERRIAQRVDDAKAMTFDQCAAVYIKSHAAGWKNEKHTAQWTATLKNYASPIFGALPVAAIDTALVMKVLEPVWSEKTETASRVRGRIESVLAWATVRGYRSGDNPARWKGHLDQLLPPRSKVRKVEHHSALPYVELPAFMAALRARDSVSARALEVTILTAARTSETVKAVWAEIDLQVRVWTIPGDRMKAGREHRVPLSDRAIEILKALPREGDFVFIGARKGSSLSNMAMLELMRGMRTGFVPHGFRSTFRDWAAERTNFPREVAEAALAHVVGDKVEAAYRRGDLFDKRRQLMTVWAEYCSAPPVDGEVVPIRRGGRDAP